MHTNMHWNSITIKHILRKSKGNKSTCALHSIRCEYECQHDAGHDFRHMQPLHRNWMWILLSKRQLNVVSVLMNCKFFHLTRFKQKVITLQQRCARSTRRLYLVRSCLYLWFLGTQLALCHPSGAYDSEMALCFSFRGKLVHPAPEHNVDIRYLIIWIWFTNLKLTLDHFKIRILHSGEVNKWSCNSSLPYAFVEGTGTIFLTLLSSSRHLQNCTSEQQWSMSECYHTHTHTHTHAFMAHTLHTDTACLS